MGKKEKNDQGAFVHLTKDIMIYRKERQVLWKDADAAVD